MIDNTVLVVHAAIILTKMILLHRYLADSRPKITTFKQHEWQKTSVYSSWSHRNSSHMYVTVSGCSEGSAIVDMHIKDRKVHINATLHSPSIVWKFYKVFCPAGWTVGGGKFKAFSADSLSSPVASLLKLKCISIFVSNFTLIVEKVQFSLQCVDLLPWYVYSGLVLSADHTG